MDVSLLVWGVSIAVVVALLAVVAARVVVPQVTVTRADVPPLAIRPSILPSTSAIDSSRIPSTTATITNSSNSLDGLPLCMGGSNAPRDRRIYSPPGLEHLDPFVPDARGLLGGERREVAPAT